MESNVKSEFKVIMKPFTHPSSFTLIENTVINLRYQQPLIVLVLLNECFVLDGHTILGSSSLSGRYWRGSVWCFKSAPLAPKKENCITGIECDNSVSDGKFLDTNKLVSFDLKLKK